MHKHIIVLCLIFTSSLFSQDLDESFLNTLPDEIRQDIITQSNDIKSLEDPVYRSIQSQTKLEKKSIEDLKNRLEADLEYLKNKLSDNGIKMNGDELPLFGKDFFSTYQSTYMPINEPNLDSSYVLDFGDILEIQLIGQKNYTDNFSLNRDGSINLPDIGQLNVGGLSLNNASSLIKARVESTFIGTKAYISLTNIRDINVLVSGNAYNPGIYTLSGNSNMLHALAVAGGINDNGSYREINLIRDEEVLETLDMYDVLITGRYKSKTKLQSGDIIFVKPSNKIVSIDGAIKIPAKYELLTNQNLSDLINYANGLTSVADLDNIFLDRILDGKVESLPIRNVKQFESIEAKDGDKVFIRKHSFRSVYIEGAVLKPGMYLMSEGESINDLINKSGGYTQNAYPFGAVYENINAKNVNKIASDKLYKEFIDNIITMSQKNPESNVDLNAIINITQNLRNNEPNGRIVIDLLNSSDADSIMIRDGDKLLIPEKPSHIYIYGEVSYEGALKFNPDNSIEDYIAKSGGFKQNADKKAIYILHPNGDTQRTLITKSLFQNNPNQNVDLYPGSVIFIPRGIDNSATNRLAAQAYVSILGNIGIALASLSSINNN